VALCLPPTSNARAPVFDADPIADGLRRHCPRIRGECLQSGPSFAAALG
jgi:hypothetical protein